MIAPPRIFFIVLLCLGTVVASTLFGLYSVRKEMDEAIAMQQRLRNDTLGNLAIASATLVWDLNEVALQNALLAQMNLPDLLGVRVYQGAHGEQELFAEVKKTGFAWEELREEQYVLSTPLLRGTREIGRIEVAISDQRLLTSEGERIRAVVLQNGVIALVLFALVVILWLQKIAQKNLETKNEEIAKSNKELEEEIQERKILETNLRQSRDEARLANKVKQEFLANMSHELRTPLNGILGLSRLLGDSPHASEEEIECFALLQESGESLQTHLDDILTYTALESGKLALRVTEFDLPTLVEELTTRAKNAASRKGLECRIQIGENLPQRIIGDRQELHRSVMALIHNAVKFTQEGAISLTVKWKPEDTCVHVEVADSGPGIPADIERKIYEPFVQLDTSASRRHSGLGLGLALAAKVVKIAGGHIRCRNPGQPCAIFEMAFPLRPVVDDLQAQLAAREKEVDASKDNFRILVVDDNDLNRRVLRLILMKSGTPAQEAASGQEALDALRSEDFDLIFMDVQMPEMDGLEATKRIRADFPGENQPFIIALTAHALPSDRQLCLEAGMDEYLSKPVEAARLLRWIDRLRRLPRRLRTGLSATRRELDPSPPE